MKYLIFDTETTGLPYDFSLSATYTDNWPRMVSFAYILCEEEDVVLAEGSFLIKPEGYSIPQEATRIHGITTAQAQKEGIPMKQALEQIQLLIDQADVVVGHNVRFDIQVVNCEMYRKFNRMPLLHKPRICTMLSSTEFCDLPNLKWPKLQELHEILFGITFDDAHDATADVNATFRCFWALVHLCIISAEGEIPPAPQIRKREETEMSGCEFAIAVFIIVLILYWIFS